MIGLACYLAETVQVVMLLNIRHSQVECLRAWQNHQLNRTHRLMAQCIRVFRRARWFVLMEESQVWLKVHDKWPWWKNKKQLANIYAQWPEFQASHDWLFNVQYLGNSAYMVCAMDKESLYHLLGRPLQHQWLRLISVPSVNRWRQWARNVQLHQRPMVYVDEHGCGRKTITLLLPERGIVRFASDQKDELQVEQQCEALLATTQYDQINIKSFSSMTSWCWSDARFNILPNEGLAYDDLTRGCLNLTELGRFWAGALIEAVAATGMSMGRSMITDRMQ